jgi:hypothetical protein
MLQLVNWLLRQVRFCIPKAAAGKSTSLYAEVILDNVPSDTNGNPIVAPSALLAALKAPDALDRLFNSLPTEERIAAQAQRAWFEELRREMVELLEQYLAAPEGDARRTVEGDAAGDIDDTPGA